MRAVLAIFLIATVVIATSVQDEVKGTIKNIETSVFGRTIMATIQLQLQTSDPLDHLLQTLNDLEDGLVAEQKDDDAQNTEFQAGCTQDLSALDRDLSQSGLKQVTLEAKLEGQLYPTRQVLQGIVSQKTKESLAYQQDINTLDSEREDAKEAFEEKVTEHEQATEVISGVRRFIAENLQSDNGEAVFLQRGAVSPKAYISAATTVLIQNHLALSAKKASKNIHRKSYAKIYKVLATITSMAPNNNQGQVANIIALIDELLAKIQDSLDLERRAEDTRIESYNKERKLVTLALQVSQTTLANVQVELASTEDQIANAETSLENTIQRIANKTQERADRYTQCEQAAQEYQDSRTQRDSDRSVLSDALGLINAQLRTLREQLALRVQAGATFGDE